MDLDATSDADRIATTLGLVPHPEGGRFAETWRAASHDGRRAAGTAIYFLLVAGERSHWHRVDAAEVWHHYAGAPLLLETSDEADVEQRVLGIDLEAGERPQLVVDEGRWQSAATLGAWTLVGCTVAPGFEFAGFELASPSWTPGGGSPPG